MGQGQAYHCPIFLGSAFGFTFRLCVCLALWKGYSFSKNPTYIIKVNSSENTWVSAGPQGLQPVPVDSSMFLSSPTLQHFAFPDILLRVQLS